MSKEIILTTHRKDKINISAYGNENIHKAPCLIFVHGFKGFKDWGFGPYLAKYFASKGYFVLTFNFSHNGIGNKPLEFTELNKFAENTFSLEIEELSEVVSSYLNGLFGSSIKKIGLLGHSRGGAISLLTAGKFAEIKAVAVWASVSNLDRYSKRQKENWRKNGVFKVLNRRTKQTMTINLNLLEDLEKNKDGSLNIKKAVENLNKPLFIAHGEEDLAVKIKEGEQIYDWANKELTEFHRISSTGHTFGIKHPFEGSNPKFENLLMLTEEFYNYNLMRG
jgi:dipeptidyl aminopeptidase/acylaminoacyl peptidase